MFNRVGLSVVALWVSVHLQRLAKPALILELSILKLGLPLDVGQRIVKICKKKTLSDSLNTALLNLSSVSGDTVP